MTDHYAKRGVSSGKEEVHAAIKGLDLGLYPLAFCKILPDLVGGDKAWFNVMHSDTAGTKTSLAYLYYKETGDPTVWKGIAQDALVMNIDDMACVGITNDIMITSVIARNKHLIPGEVISTIIQWLPVFIEEMAKWGIRLHACGGETADVGDIVRTIDVGYSTFGRAPKQHLLVNDIRPGQAIVGFASYGHAVYEQAYNSGIGSNGLTSARHDVLHSFYKEQFPESFAPETDPSVVYTGQYRLTDQVILQGETFSISDLFLSPTRTYLPLISHILDTHRGKIHGLIHCTGGGHTKVGKFITAGAVVKDHLLPVPPVFQLIQSETGAADRELFQVFNMGQRLECYCDESIADDLIRIALALNIPAQRIGHVEASEIRKVVIRHKGETHEYVV